MKKKKIEEVSADVILEEKKNIVLGETTYDVAPPTIGTLIRASKYIGRLPKVSKVTDDNYLQVALSVAEDCKALPYVFAVFILGNKKIEQSIRGFEGHVRRLLKRDKLCLLAKKIGNESTPKQLNHALKTMLGDMQLAFFLSTITFLSEVNMLKTTKIQTTEATAVGQ